MSVSQVVLYFMSVSQWYCILCQSVSVSGIVFYVSQSVVLYFMSVSQCILCQAVSGYILCKSGSGIVFYVSQSVVLYFM